MSDNQTQVPATPPTDAMIPVRVRVYMLAKDLDSGLFAQAFANQESLDEEIKDFLKEHDLKEGEDDGKNLYAWDHSDLQIMLPESIARMLAVTQGVDSNQIDLEALLTFAEQSAQHFMKTGFPRHMLDTLAEQAAHHFIKTGVTPDMFQAQLDNAKGRADAEDAAASPPAPETPASKFTDVFASLMKMADDTLRGTPVDSSPRPARRPR